jgi:hypothetical protein
MALMPFWATCSVLCFLYGYSVDTACLFCYYTIERF